MKMTKLRNITAPNRYWCVGIVLLYVAQSVLPASAQQQTVTVTVYDTDSGHPLSNTPVELTLFPPEHGARKMLPKLCVPMVNARAAYSYPVHTDVNGSFAFTAPGGDYLAKVSIPSRQDIFGCIHVDTHEFLRSCGAQGSAQQLFVRTTASIAGFSGDILENSPCAQSPHSLCDPLQVPNLVARKQLLFLDADGSPIPHTHVEFRGLPTRTQAGKLYEALSTNENGVADVSRLLRLGGSFHMSIHTESESDVFLIRSVTGGTPGRQTVRIFKWKCGGDRKKGALIESPQ
jgi:hypothetical protein